MAVHAMYERLTTPGSIVVVNCGSADERQVVHGHPRIRPEKMMHELVQGQRGKSFRIVAAFESVYDMLSVAPDRGGVVSWVVVLERLG